MFIEFKKYEDKRFSTIEHSIEELKTLMIQALPSNQAKQIMTFKVFSKKHGKFNFSLTSLDTFDQFLMDLNHNINNITLDLVREIKVKMFNYYIFINLLNKITGKSLVFNYP